MWLIRASLQNAYMVATLVFMLLALGVVALTSIPIDILPVFKSPAVQVLTYYQGMPASSVEKTITNRIERWVNQAPGAARVESKSVPGVSIVKIFFRDDIDPNAALTMTNSLALGTLPTLPPNTLPPVVLPFDPTGTLPLGILTVSIPGKTEADVKDYARIDVRNMLGAVPGCVAPVVVGGKDRTILIYLKPKEMEARNVSPLDVVERPPEGQPHGHARHGLLRRQSGAARHQRHGQERRRAERPAHPHQGGRQRLPPRHRPGRRFFRHSDLPRAHRRPARGLRPHLPPAGRQQPDRGR